MKNAPSHFLDKAEITDLTTVELLVCEDRIDESKTKSDIRRLHAKTGKWILGAASISEAGMTFLQPELTNIVSTSATLALSGIAYAVEKRAERLALVHDFNMVIVKEEIDERIHG